MSDSDREAGGVEARQAVDALHDEVDDACAPLSERHAERLQCRLGCAACCVDDLTVFEVEAERILREHAELLEHEAPHPPGACAFLGQAGECRIYRSRPYVCRTQGLPLRWWVEDVDDEIVERRSICELNETEAPIESIADEDCWLIGPIEDRLIRLQAERDGQGTTRVALRTLFRRGHAGARRGD